MIFETHAHYDDEAFDTDREELLLSMQDGGVETIVNIGADVASSKQTLEFCDKYPFIYGAIGVHPSNTNAMTEEDFKWLEETAKKYRMKAGGKVVAIGEIGLDYYWDKEDVTRANQRKWFERQTVLAEEMGLPIVIHSRDAAKDTMDMMKAMNAGEIGGIIHCYSYAKEQAREYLDMGFFFGIGGVLTFSNAKKLKEVVEYLPMDAIVLETDCPYLAPVPNRGKRNSSLNLIYVAEEIAKIKGKDVEKVIEQTKANARRVYRFDT
ncbi:MAG: TatD family hydrolase [Lachnospiraceae bacterium]|nr:TatD family hydrolase [Lachnospiraceae bacterium]